MKDLVAVGVADAAEQHRRGKAPLERVILRTNALAELVERGVEHLEPAATMLGKSRGAADEVD